MRGHEVPFGFTLTEATLEPTKLREQSHGPAKALPRDNRAASYAILTATARAFHLPHQYLLRRVLGRALSISVQFRFIGLGLERRSPNTATGPLGLEHIIRKVSAAPSAP